MRKKVNKMPSCANMPVFTQKISLLWPKDAISLIKWHLIYTTHHICSKASQKFENLKKFEKKFEINIIVT